MSRLSQLVVFLSLVSVGLSIPEITPFAVDGGLDACVPDTGDYNVGGSITAHGIKVVVPKNLIAQFPTTWVPFKQMCGAKFDNYEVSISGNVVRGQPIAAQISVGSPFFLEGSQGYIKSVDLTDGSFQIDGGPKVILNDPNAVYSRGTNPPDLFPIDEENPSVSAFSGFPMCVPRNSSDPLCPSTNRPAGGQRNFQPKEPLLMAPLIAGDFIIYSGVVRNGVVYAWSVTADNVQITTVASNTVPNYIRMEEAIIGVFDNQANVEVADGRFIGYLSSCNGATVTISAIDVDPCTGKESYRQIGSAIPKTGDARCKWELRYDTTTSSVNTREYLIRANNPVITTKNGIRAGQYVMPVSEWIQPEVDVPGTEPPPFRFSDIRGLVQGDFLDNKQYGPLDPFPGPKPPAPSKTCNPTDIPTGTPTSTPTPVGPFPDPVASVVPIPAIQRVGSQFQLVASNARPGIPSDQLVFEWTQNVPASPRAVIQGADQPTATVVAPSVVRDTTFTFQVTISLKSNSSQSSLTRLNVKVSVGADIVTLDSYVWDTRQGGTLSVTCHSNVINGDVKSMRLVLNQNTATGIAMSRGDGPGRFVHEGRSTKKPTNVQCVSPLGGKSRVVSATTARRRRCGGGRS